MGGPAISILALTGSALALTSGTAMAQSTQANDGDIIVTAQRRSQRLVDVPISVSTASSDDLEQAGPTSLENLTKVVPGIYLQRDIYGLSPTIRGIGSTLGASGGEQNVATYVDEIYYAAPTGNIFDLGSVAGVEVLKGPQGTLFGRNATGGAILIRTLDPDVDAVTGRFNASFERFRQVRTSSYINVPISDTVAINGAVAYRYSRGYMRDLLTGAHTNQAKSFTARAKMLLKPTDNLSIVLVAAHANFSDPTGNRARNLQPSPLVQALGGPISTDRFVSSDNTDVMIKTKTREYSARAKLELGGGTLSSLTAFLKNRLDSLNEIDFSYLDQNVFLTVKNKSLTQEVNYASSPDDPLSYVVGVYYFRSNGSVPTLTSNDAPIYNTVSSTRALSTYADGTYKFGNFSVIAGIRYSHEKRRAAAGFGANAPSPFDRFQNAVDKQWTPRLGLRYALADRTNIYAMFSKGFKSGAFDTGSPTAAGVAPEKLNAYEIGFKTASSELNLNAAVFYYDYIDTQVNSTVAGPNGQVFNQLFNVPKSESYGAEIDATFRVSENLDVRAAAAYTRARYLDFKAAPAYRADASDPATLGGLLFSNYSLDVSGNTMVRSPKFTASGSVTYRTPIGDDNELSATLSPYYSSRVFFNFENSRSQPAYLTLDASASLSVGPNLKFSIFGRNITDKAYKTAVYQNILSLNVVNFAAPATYGASFGYSF